MLLHELDEHVDGAEDQIIFANYDDLNTVPNNHVSVSDKLVKFFEQVSGWINDEDYFQDNAPQVMVPELDSVSFLYDSNGDLITGENSDETQTRNECTSDSCFDDDLECTSFTLAPIFCVIVYGDIGDIGGLGDSGNPCSVVAFSCGYGTDPYDVEVEDAHDDPNQGNVYAVVEVEFHKTATIAVPDYSGFDRKALDLVSDLFAPVRDSGTIVPGSVEAIEIASTLEGYLKTTIFAGALNELGAGVFPPIQDYELFKIIVRIILIVLEYIVNREGEEEETTTTPPDPDRDPPTNPDQNCELRTDQDCPEEPIIPVTPVPEEEIDPMVTISATTTGALKINTVPAMPAALFSALVHNWPENGEENLVYTWNAELEFKKPGDDSITLSSHDIGPQINRHTMNEDEWSPVWGDLIEGGNMTVSVEVILPGVAMPLRDEATFTITGENPDTSQIEGVTGTGEVGNIRLAVAWAESTHRQFNAARNGGIGYALVVNNPDGWGLMQLDNLGDYATKGEPVEGQLKIDDEHLWNWRSNLQMGMGYLDRTYDDAQSWLVTKYNEVHEDIDTDNDWPTTGDDAWRPDQAATVNAVAKRIWNDALSRYNTGERLYSGDGNRGQVDCGADRIDRRGRTTLSGEDGNTPNMQFDGCDYYLDVRDHVANTPWND